MPVLFISPDAFDSLWKLLNLLKKKFKNDAGWVSVDGVCCSNATKKPFIPSNSLKRPSALVQYTQPSEIGGWLSV
jgi:hypothetical protein